MKNTKLVEEAKLNPGRIYHRPHDVLRDRRLKDPDRLEILAAWETGLRTSGGAEAQRIEEISAARLEIEGRLRTAAE
jgi:hypothetical protein